jgi:beta-glucosidase
LEIHVKALGVTLLCTCLGAGLALTADAAGSDATPKPLQDWPRIESAIGKDPALEARIRKIVAEMTLAQKIGQMTQPEITSVTPAEVRS